MIERKDILSLAYLKKSPFTGGYQGMRYRLEKKEKGEEMKLRSCIWVGPYSYDAVSEEKKQNAFFAFSEEGICQAVEWMNERWEEKKDLFKSAKQNW